MGWRCVGRPPSPPRVRQKSRYGNCRGTASVEQLRQPRGERRPQENGDQSNQPHQHEWIRRPENVARLYFLRRHAARIFMALSYGGGAVATGAL